MELVRQHGTPLQLISLPKISEHIHHTKSMFARIRKRYNYQGGPTHCYSMKSSEHSVVLDELLSNGDIHIETSSLDMSAVRELYGAEKINKSTFIICVGPKQSEHRQEITKLLDEGFNVLPVLDNFDEIHAYKGAKAKMVDIGIRVATSETNSMRNGTSRLGLRYEDLDSFLCMKLQRNPKFRLRLLYFYVDAGIRNAGFYWTELICFIQKYCELRKTCSALDSIHIAGDLPMRRSFSFSRYERMFSLIIKTITDICLRNDVLVPRIFTDFGTYALRGSGATMYKIIEQSAQEDAEMRYIVNGPLPQPPNTTGPKERFMALPLNNNNRPHCNASLRGSTCSSADCMSIDPQFTGLHLPQFDQEKEEQYVGIFNAGAYAKPLITAPSKWPPVAEYVIICKDANGHLASNHVTSRQGNKNTIQHESYVNCNAPLRCGYY